MRVLPRKGAVATEEEKNNDFKDLVVAAQA